MMTALDACITLFFLILAALPGVDAHGYVKQITFAGKDYIGPKPSFGYSHPNVASVIRQYYNGFPTKGANNANLSCGMDAQPASDMANVMPSDEVQVWWSALDGKQVWPHNLGPVMTYLADCGKKNCSDVDGKSAKWFKINEKGRDDTNIASNHQGVYASDALNKGKPYTFTIPENLAAGSYLMRSEVIALHFATKMLDPNDAKTGAEFYPSCSQIAVGGSGTGKPEENELVSMPGAYKDDDPGLFVPKLYYNPDPYVIPGPAVAAFVNNGEQSSSTTSSVTRTSPSSTTAQDIPSQTASRSPVQQCKRGYSKRSLAKRTNHHAWVDALRRSINHQ